MGPGAGPRTWSVSRLTHTISKARPCSRNTWYKASSRCVSGLAMSMYVLGRTGIQNGYAGTATRQDVTPARGGSDARGPPTAGT